MDARDRLICALDFPTFDEAKALVEELGDAVTFYKVGMELFYGAGPDIIRYLINPVCRSRQASSKYEICRQFG